MTEATMQSVFLLLYCVSIHQEAISLSMAPHLVSPCQAFPLQLQGCSFQLLIGRNHIHNYNVCMVPWTPTIRPVACVPLVPPRYTHAHGSLHTWSRGHHQSHGCLIARPIPFLVPWTPSPWTHEYAMLVPWVTAISLFFFILFYGLKPPFSVVLNSSKLLAYLPVLPWAAGAAEESEVSVDTVAVVDVASDNFAATSLSIHACCASVNDGISTSTGSDIAWSSAAVIMIPSWGSWLVTTKARFVTPRTHAHNFCTCDHPPRVRSSLLTWSK